MMPRFGKARKTGGRAHTLPLFTLRLPKPFALLNPIQPSPEFVRTVDRFSFPPSDSRRRSSQAFAPLSEAAAAGAVVSGG